MADIDNQNQDNYHYDETGNLIKDLAEGIDKITWTVYGKIASIEKANGTTIRYSYDPSGNRISKLVQRSSGDKNYTWYVRDAQGNVMATYSASGEGEDLAELNLKLSERHLYGSIKLGILTEPVDVDNNNAGPEAAEEELTITYARGHKQYELTNHLGNVLATVSDKKTGIDSDDDGEINYFEHEIITAVDYYPFGMLMPGRGGSLINGQWQESGPAVLANLFVDSRSGNQPLEYVALESIEFLPGFESGSSDEFIAYITTSGTGSGYEGKEGMYRYGFNGKENDDEVKGVGNQIDYGMRIDDPRLGRFLSVDPLTKSYPMLTPYQFAANSPIAGIDLDGLEFYYTADGKLHRHKTAWLSNNKPIPANIANQLRVAYNFKNAEGYITFNYQMFHETNEETRNKILHSIYETQIGGKIPPKLTTYDDGRPKVAGSTARDKSYMNLDASTQWNGEYLFDNFYNLVNVTYHESLHFNSKGQSSDAFSHYEIFKKQVSHTSWSNTTDNFRAFQKEAASGNIEDMESLTSGLATFVNKSPDRKTVFKSKQDEASFNYYYEKYKSAVQHFNKTFNEKKEIISKEQFLKPFEVKKDP